MKGLHCMFPWCDKKNSNLDISIFKEFEFEISYDLR